MKTWLTCDGYGEVYRHTKYEDGYESEPEHIGNIELADDGYRWFQMYGDNRTLNVAELRQILDFI